MVAPGLEYRLTPKGSGLFHVIVGLRQWGKIRASNRDETHFLLVDHPSGADPFAGSGFDPRTGAFLDPRMRSCRKCRHALTSTCDPRISWFGFKKELTSCTAMTWQLQVGAWRGCSRAIGAANAGESARDSSRPCVISRRVLAVGLHHPRSAGAPPVVRAAGMRSSGRRQIRGHENPRPAGCCGSRTVTWPPTGSSRQISVPPRRGSRLEVAVEVIEVGTLGLILPGDFRAGEPSREEDSADHGSMRARLSRPLEVCGSPLGGCRTTSACPLVSTRCSRPSARPTQTSAQSWPGSDFGRRDRRRGSSGRQGTSLCRSRGGRAWPPPLDSSSSRRGRWSRLDIPADSQGGNATRPAIGAEAQAVESPFAPLGELARWSLPVEPDAVGLSDLLPDHLHQDSLLTQ